MIFWIGLSAFVISLVVAIATYRDFELLFTISIPLSVATGVASIMMVIFVIANNVGVDGMIEANKQRYESLVYQAENNLYDNDNDLGKKELANQIQKWNEDLAKGKMTQNDFWVGIFYADIYDGFDFIPMSVLDKEKRE